MKTAFCHLVFLYGESQDISTGIEYEHCSNVGKLSRTGAAQVAYLVVGRRYALSSLCFNYALSCHFKCFGKLVYAIFLV